MACFNKLPSGKWRAQVRVRGQYASRSFRLKSEAWAREIEIAMISGKSAKAAVRVSEKTAFGILLDLHIDDMREVGKSPRRSKKTSLEKLTRRRLKRGVFHSLVDLQTAINRFINEHNRQPKPFVWKTDPDKVIAARKRGFQTLESIH